ncbi:MAG: zinc ribbon domain-containing protein, partial [Dissulfurimicrobium sp.]
DLKIKELETKKAAAPRRLEALKNNLAIKEVELKQLNEQLAAVKKRKFDIEDELKMEMIRLNKSQQKLNSIKTNREYQALLKEIDEIKKANKSREDEMIAAMEELESIEVSIKTKKSETDDIQKEIDAENAHLIQIENELNRQLDVIMKQRDIIVKDIRQDLLSRYHFLRDKRGGIVIVSVTEGVCNGCHMNLPPQLFNELLRDEKIHYCPTCQRLIYAKINEENDGHPKA